VSRAYLAQSLGLVLSCPMMFAIYTTINTRYTLLH